MARPSPIPSCRSYRQSRRLPEQATQPKTKKHAYPLTKRLYVRKVRQRRPPSSGAARTQQLLDVLGQHVAVKIESVARASRAEVRACIGVGNDGDAEERAFQSRDGEADAVHRDGAFEDKIAVEFGGDAEVEPPVAVP